MNSGDRLITTSEVREVIFKGNVIEERKTDLRGESYLLSGKVGSKRVVHVVCSPKENFLVIVTVYVPDPSEWDEKLTRRS